VTANGNIAEFSRAGLEFLNPDVVNEGYGICSDFWAPPPPPPGYNIHYFDYGGFTNGWGPVTVVNTTLTSVKLSRITLDGAFTLTQTIYHEKANAQRPAAARIAMSVRNNTSANHRVFLFRHAGVDVSSSADDDSFGATKNTAFGSDGYGAFGGEPYPAGGLTATDNHTSPVYSSTSFIHDGAYTHSGPDPCGSWPPYLGSPPPFVGDGGLGMFWDFTLNARKTKTVTMTYKPF
jgi:hypothetical protein